MSEEKYYRRRTCRENPQELACVAGGMRERASGGGAVIFLAGKAREELRLFTNPLTASPLAFTASLPKQKHSRTKSRQLRRLAGVKGSESRFASVMKFGRYVTVDDGGNHVTFHELNQRLRKDKKITKAQSDSVSNREF